MVTCAIAIFFAIRADLLQTIKGFCFQEKEQLSVPLF